MLYYNRNDFSEGIMLIRQVHLRSVFFCHYWYFLDKGLSFNQQFVMADVLNV